MKPNSCWMCRTSFTKKNSCTSVRHHGCGLCRICAKLRARRIYGHKPKNFQIAGKFHTFPVCGCSGILPPTGGSNLFAYKGMCRVSKIIWSNAALAKNRKYKPINPNTPHSIIRKMMKKNICELCRKPLTWTLAHGKTPHLHHDHKTGEIYGFTHPKCNPRALENEIENLRKEIKRLTVLV